MIYYSHCIFITWHTGYLQHLFTLCIFYTGKPDAPQKIEVVGTHKSSVDLKWAAPKSDGGSPITGYIIEKQDMKRGSWLSVGTVSPGHLQYTVSKLVEGNDYLFRISAENEVGVSLPTETNTVTAKSKHSKYSTCVSGIY